jgi:catechol 2,3-dioxygenase-like lactoylglutathione lyase family enzyme
MFMETETGADMRPWPTGIFAITLFVEDLAAAKEFYQKVFGLPVDYADDNSTVFKFGNTWRQSWGLHCRNQRRSS